MLKFKNYSIRNYLKTKQQQGASVIVAAFSIPLMMIGGVAAVDLGAYWSHATELQNAADAAALAGAAAFVKNENTVSSHDDADEEAGRYVGINLNDDENKAYTEYTKNNPRYGVAEITAKDYWTARGKSESEILGEDKYKGFVYYRVRLNDTSPSYFAKFFKLGDPEVEVTAVAQIAASNHAPTEAPLTDLFMTKTGFDVVNTINNPDTFTRDNNGAENMSGGILSSFDGHVSVLSKDLPDYALSGSSQLSNCPFYTSAAYEASNSDTNPLANYNFYMDPYKGEAAQFNADGDITDNSAYYTYPEYKEYSMEDTFVTAMKDKVAKYAGDPVGSSSQTINISDNLSSFTDDVIHVTSQVQNLTLNIDTALPGSDTNDKNSPLFLYIDEAVSGLVKINVSESNGRPLIICAPTAYQVELTLSGSGDTSDINNERFENTKDPNADVVGSGNAVFRGIVCAPNAYMLCHPNGGAILGTLMSNFLKLDGVGRYKYENFSFGGDGKGSTEDVDIDFDSEISLVPPPSNVSWTET